ncbi:hypothetical protein G7046_g5341 [Stylonectria norvegica]|nr:hypothetical protein G7046_g5341 [Stylonectria norvegica]
MVNRDANGGNKPTSTTDVNRLFGAAQRRRAHFESMAPVLAASEGVSTSQTLGSDWPRSALPPEDKDRLQDLTLALENCASDDDRLEVFDKKCTRWRGDNRHPLLLMLSHQLMQQKCSSYPGLVRQLLAEQHISVDIRHWKSFVTGAVTATDSWSKCRVPLKAVLRKWVSKLNRIILARILNPTAKHQILRLVNNNPLEDGDLKALAKWDTRPHPHSFGHGDLPDDHGFDRFGLLVPLQPVVRVISDVAGDQSHDAVPEIEGPRCRPEPVNTSTAKPPSPSPPEECVTGTGDGHAGETEEPTGSYAAVTSESSSAGGKVAENEEAIRAGEDLQYVKDVIDEIEQQVNIAIAGKHPTRSASSYGHQNDTSVLRHLRKSTPPSDTELHFCMTTGEARKLVEHNYLTCPVVAKGQQAFEWEDGSRPIQQLLNSYITGYERTVSVQVPSLETGPTKPSFKEEELAVIKDRFEKQSRASDDPWNVLDLANPVKNVIPKFLTGPNCQLLQQIRDRLLSRSSALRTEASYVETRTWRDVLEWLLLSQGGNNTAPHTDSHGYSTWISPQEGKFGFGWMHKPTVQEWRDWTADPIDYDGGGQWRYVILRPGQTVFFPSGTIHYVFRCRADQTFAIGGHVLQWPAILQWLDVVERQMLFKNSTNEDVDGTTICEYIRVINELLKQRLSKKGPVGIDNFEVGNKFLARSQTFLEKQKEKKNAAKKGGKKRAKNRR